MNNLDVLIKRTNLNISFDEFLKDIEGKFTSIGKIGNYSPINEGYEDANIILNTSTGKYVLKIFLAERELGNINSYVKILTECKKVGVPTTEILLDFNNGLGVFENEGIKTYYIITKFFEGNNFQNTTPTIEDIRKVTECVAKLNTLNFEVGEGYDSWGIKAFPEEYKNKKEKLTPEQDSLIKDIYEEYLKLDMTSFSKSVIHGDMQRKHVIKNSNNEYCILDFGCMAYDYKVIELATYLAWFCIQKDTWKDKDLIYKEVLDIYNSIHHLSEQEILSLPLLIKVSCSAYYVTTSVMINEGDTSEETLDWHNRSKKLLELSKISISNLSTLG
ncbi:MAG: phosphotransferase [bacterium]|nr:MAG: phosphotransferase [bacterium]